MNFKLIGSFGTSKWNNYSLCDRLYLKVTQKWVHLQICTAPVAHFSKFFHRGCLDFKWSSPLYPFTDKRNSNTVKLVSILGCVLSTLHSSYIKLIPLTSYLLHCHTCTVIRYESVWVIQRSTYEITVFQKHFSTSWLKFEIYYILRFCSCVNYPTILESFYF